MPSDAELMQMAIDDLNNSSSSLGDRQRALQELLILVEPLDNANGKCNSCYFQTIQMVIVILAIFHKFLLGHEPIYFELELIALS